MGFGETQEQAVQNHDKNLIKVNLCLNGRKELKKPEVKLMGHIVSKNGLKPDVDKVKAVEQMPHQTRKVSAVSSITSQSFCQDLQM